MQGDKTAGLAPKLTGGLVKGAKGLAGMAAKRVLSSATDRLGETTQRLTDYAISGGGPGLLSAVTGNGGKGDNRGKGKTLKVTNIVEHIDIGVPLRLVYDQWTRFTDFPSFMKKVEAVDQEEDEKLQWKAQILWSHRIWEATIVEQVPDHRIVWRSEGQKGTVDGAVTFHELAPELTRVMLVLQYHPQGLFERTGNIWRAQGRRARLELKHFARHVMSEAVLHPDEIEGWRGEIHDSQVTKDNDQARAEEQEARTRAGAADQEGRSRARAEEQEPRRRSREREPQEPTRRPDGGERRLGGDELRARRRGEEASGAERPRRPRDSGSEDRPARRTTQGRDGSRRVAS